VLQSGQARVASDWQLPGNGCGFALSGGNAPLAHGVISPPTRDVDLFADQEHGGQAGARSAVGF
jgi:hypothetical protein